MVQELEYDPDKDFLLDVICTAFKLLLQDSLLQPAEMHNYHFTLNTEARSKVKNIIKAEMYERNYIKVSHKPTTVSAIGAVSKGNSSELKLTHDCSMPCRLGINSSNDIKKQSFQTIDDAVSFNKTEISHGQSGSPPCL